MTFNQYIEDLPAPQAPEPWAPSVGTPAPPSSSDLLPDTGFDLFLLVVAFTLILVGLAMTLTNRRRR